MLNQKIVVLVLLCLLVLAACQPENTCTQHGDINLDGKCDTCGVVLEAPSTTDPIQVEVSFAVFNQYGKAMENAMLTLQSVAGGVPQNAVVDAGGGCKLTLVPGEYQVILEDLPEYHIPDVSTITVQEGMGLVELTVTDNTPNGTENRPFFIGDEETSYHFAANEELWFHVRRGSDRSVIIQNPNVQVTLDGKLLTPDDAGQIVIRPESGDSRDYISFSVKNLDSTEQDVSVKLMSDPGTSQNPYIVDSLGQLIEVQVPADGSVCYKYVATAAGDLVLTTSNKGSSISMNNLMSYRDTGFSAGEETITIPVEVGDEVLITVSTTDGSTEVSFTLSMD